MAPQGHSQSTSQQEPTVPEVVRLTETEVE